MNTEVLTGTSNHIETTGKIGNMIGSEFPKDAEGRVYHLQIKKGEVANRVLLVGDLERAKIIKECFDTNTCTEYSSTRGFTTYTGKRKGIDVTVMGMGMGYPMMEFAVKEIRGITEGPLEIIRLGSCGTPREDISIGTVVVAKESYMIQTNYSAYQDNADFEDNCFIITKPIAPDSALHATLVKTLKIQAKTAFPIIEASDATADTFYAAQGRVDPAFDDRNQDLIERINSLHPNTGSLQMETFHLFHLARLNQQAMDKQNLRNQGIRAAACAIILANRQTGEFLSNEDKHKIERVAGEACLDALIASKA